MPSSAARACLLDLDPDLVDDLSAEDRAAARGRLPVHVAELRRGPWTPAPKRPAALTTLLVVDGFLRRELDGADGRRSTQLLGPGATLDPWQAGEGPAAPTGWTAMTPVRLAAITPALLQEAARFPGVLAALVRRLGSWTEHVCGLLTVATLPRVEDRIDALLRLMADRWGHVTPEGTVLELALTHEQLGELIGARRPTVTLGLAQLEAQGKVQRRRRDGVWVLAPAGA